MKALVFTVILLMLTIGAFTATIAMVWKSSSKISDLGDVGAKAIGIIEANQKADSIALFVRKAAIKATESTTENLMNDISKTAEQAFTTECGTNPYPVWYKKGKCTLKTYQILNTIAKEISNKMKEYATLYNDPNAAISKEYEITIFPENQKTRIIGRPLQPTLILVDIPSERANAKAIATIAADTGFEISTPFDLEAILRLTDNIEEIHACVQKEAETTEEINTEVKCLENIHPKLQRLKFSEKNKILIRLKPENTKKSGVLFIIDTSQ
ncbi:hypothetical protein HY486_02820 [Candidatus Woesearchaeota archaeon]|nr:hypothetical protein [Candidatus Woesearchaeota archaeon]